MKDESKCGQIGDNFCSKKSKILDPWGYFEDITFCKNSGWYFLDNFCKKLATFYWKIWSHRTTYLTYLSKTLNRYGFYKVCVLTCFWYKVTSSVTVDQCDQKKIAKCLQKLPKNDFARKIKDFDTFTKIDYECGSFGQTNCCHRLWKVVQSPINRQSVHTAVDDVIGISVTLTTLMTNQRHA